MYHRLTRITIILTLVLLSVSRAPADPEASDGLTVHEWGTFTSIAGEDGMAVEWKPLAGPDDLPCFVDRLRFSVKGLIPGAPRDLTVSVSVRFRQGVLTEWFPKAAVTPSSVTFNSLRDPAFESSITWDDVRVVPASAPEFPMDEGASHYYAARDTDASPLESGDENEKFLFYRGVGAFDPPLTAVVDPEGKIVVANPLGEPVGDVMLFENRGGAIAYELQHAGDSRMTFDPPGVPLTTSPSARFGADGSFPPLVELERLLMAHGLYPKEAAAMVQTWRDSWVRGGDSALLHRAPRGSRCHSPVGSDTGAHRARTRVRRAHRARDAGDRGRRARRHRPARRHGASEVLPLRGRDRLAKFCQELDGRTRPRAGAPAAD